MAFTTTSSYLRNILCSLNYLSLYKRMLGHGNAHFTKSKFSYTDPEALNNSEAVTPFLVSSIYFNCCNISLAFSLSL